MANESLPLRKGDMLFVAAIVMVALSLPATTATVTVGGAVALWIRFRVYSGRDR